MTVGDWFVLAVWWLAVTLWIVVLVKSPLLEWLVHLLTEVVLVAGAMP